MALLSSDELCICSEADMKFNQPQGDGRVHGLAQRGIPRTDPGLSATFTTHSLYTDVFGSEQVLAA